MYVWEGITISCPGIFELCAARKTDKGREREKKRETRGREAPGFLTFWSLLVLWSTVTDQWSLGPFCQLFSICKTNTWDYPGNQLDLLPSRVFGLHNQSIGIDKRPDKRLRQHSIGGLLQCGRVRISEKFLLQARSLWVGSSWLLTRPEGRS